MFTRKPCEQAIYACSRAMLWRMDTDWWNYVSEVAGGATQRSISVRTDIEQSAISRWKRGKGISVESVIKFARAYGRPPVEAIIAAGYITADEAGVPISVQNNPPLDEIPTEELHEEIGRRLGLSRPFTLGSRDTRATTAGKGAVAEALGLNGTPATDEEVAEARRKSRPLSDDAQWNNYVPPPAGSVQDPEDRSDVS